MMGGMERNRSVCYLGGWEVVVLSVPVCDPAWMASEAETLQGARLGMGPREYWLNWNEKDHPCGCKRQGIKGAYW